jgi:serine phosphatase RsbU (regulator of sigma subunit)
MTLRLRVQPAGGGASERALDGDELTIGRGAGSTVVITDPRVSRRHARLTCRNGGWWVEDLGARNCTLLNGVPVEGAQPLAPGDRLDIGDAVLRIVDDAAAPSAPARQTGAEHTSFGIPRGASPDAARMRTINEIHRAIAEPLSLAELLDVILARCFDVLAPEEGVVMLRGRDGSLVPAASRRASGALDPVTVPRRLVDEVIGKRAPALVLDAAYDDRFTGSASIVSSGIRSIVAAPIVDPEGPFGLITMCSRIAVRQFSQQDLDLLVTIATAAGLRIRNVALADELATRRVLEHELQVAHDVQMAMLPRTMPVAPGLEVAATVKPARSVGGDLYDVFIRDNRLWFIVADVAGKSIPAALYMAIARALFRATAGVAADVAEVAQRMNDELARDNEQLMFVTAAIGALDLATGRLSLVDAGHLPPLLVHSAGITELDPGVKGPALGVVPGASYNAADIELPSNAMLVLYTDGVTEARAPDGALFGNARLHAVLEERSNRTADDVVRAVVAAVDRFAGAAPQEDDVTMLAVRWRD